ncbi:MAG: hypothetical protein ABIE84_01875 [bacterium]
MIIIVLGLPMLLGLFFLSLLMRKQASSYSIWEKLALSFAIGLGVLTIIMYLLALIEIPLSLPIITIAITIVIGLISIWLLSIKTFCLTVDEIKSAFNLQGPKPTWPEIILLVIIGLKVVFAFFTALVKPVIDVDAFHFYSIVAKGIFYTGKIFDPYLAQFMGDKPPFPFIAQGWAFIGLGSINDAHFKILPPVMFLSLLIIFYSALKRAFPRWCSLLFTFMLSSLSFMLYHVGTAYSDFPMTFYFSIGTIYLYLFMKEQANNNKEKSLTDLFIAVSLLGIAVWVKRAGLILVGADILMLFGFLFVAKRSYSANDWRKIGIALSIFLLITLPWLSQGQIGTFVRILGSLTGLTAETALPTTAAVQASSVNGKTGTIAAIFMKKLFLYGDWQLSWALFVVTLIFFYKRALKPPLSYLLAIIVISVMSIIVQFGSNNMFPWLLDGTLSDRLIMNVMPLVIFYCAEAIIPSLTANSSAAEQ